MSVETATFSRRRVLTSILSTPGLLAAGQAAAQPATWPTKAVRIIVGLAPGGLADVLTRTVQPHLTAALGQPVIVDNRGGAGGNVAGAEVARNGGDGHTFLVVPSTTESVNPSMFARMPFDPQHDLRPVGLLANSQLFLFVRPTLGVQSLEAFIAHAKAHPNTLSYGSAGNGTTPHLAGELLKQGAGITATHVAYRGAAPAIQDVMAGQVDFAFGPATVLSSVKAGRLKVLAVASRKRAAVAPEVRTFSEVGIDGVFADSLFGIYAPSGAPNTTVERLNREINKILERPDVRSKFLDAGAEAVPLRATEYAAQVQEEKRLFTGVVRALGIKAE